MSTTSSTLFSETFASENELVDKSLDKPNAGVFAAVLNNAGFLQDHVAEPSLHGFLPAGPDQMFHVKHFDKCNDFDPYTHLL
jgi:hypothetical protein